MSILQRESIRVIAQTLGINNLDHEIAQAIASDVEYRIREIIQDASKFMKHSKRKILTTEDVNHALTLKNVEPLYGFSTGEGVSFKKVAHTQDLFYLEDPEIDIHDCLRAPLPKVPLGPTVSAHWLAIEGVQPRIPQNPTIVTTTATSTTSTTTTTFSTAAGATVTIPKDKTLVKHVLSAELQLYYEKVTEAVKESTSMEGTPKLQAALYSLAHDPGIGQLVPYFTQFVADEVVHNLRNVNLLYHLMEVVKALLQNPHLNVELYLHQLMPPLMTCLVGKRLCQNPSEDHWRLREFSARIIAYICKTYGSSYHTLQPRITKTLLMAFLDPSKPLTTHYGAIVGMNALGPHVTQLLLLEQARNSNLVAFSKLLEPELNSTNPARKLEALKCYGALLDAATTFFVRTSAFFRVYRDAGDSESDFTIEEEGGRESVQPRRSLAASSASSAVAQQMKDRLNALCMPSHIADRYKELYEVFGESILPSIFYRILPDPKLPAESEIFL
eukprot:GEZU01024416.1.p1 GENE.GEZU01024416.1~~GEZU01024416.1.p1  ORF type:complete len:501 (-),score=37.46 GEZU01024416.1:103-1605(-)